MIESIRHKGLRLFFEHGDGSRLPADMLARIRLILTALEASQTIDGMDNPLFKLHPLKGRLRGYWAVTVHANWRIIFRFDGGKARDVDFVDYH
jgi:proteic killer suppression protein